MWGANKKIKMSEDEKNNLKLIAKNEEDLNVISAYIQNSIMIVNRFMWEDIEKGINRESKRMRCSLKFEEVLKVKEKKIKQKNKNKLLECLAIECGKILSKNNQIIFFVGGGYNYFNFRVYRSYYARSW